MLGQVAFQWAFLLRHPREQKLSYAWILIAISSLGAILLWPMLALIAWTTAFARASVLFPLGWFFAVVGIMFVVHWRLVVRVHLPKWLCATWVIYRLCLLVFLVRWR